MSEDVKISMTIRNKTKYNLEYDSSHLEYGKFWEPPKTIHPDSEGRAFVACGTKGTATGTEGWVRYKLATTDYYVKISFDIPYSASNKIFIDASDKVDAILEDSAPHGSPEPKLTVRMR